MDNPDVDTSIASHTRVLNASAPTPADPPNRAARRARATRWGSAMPAIRDGVGRKLLAWILLFSTAVTLVTTLIQLYVDYRRDLDTIDVRLREIESGYLESLSGSLWHVDTAQLRLQLDGIVRLPDMRAAEVRESNEDIVNPVVVRAESRPGHSVLAREVPIFYEVGGVWRNIGVLRLEATLDGVYQRLIDTTLVILVTQGIKTFLVSLFILYIVHRLVTRHLTAISRYFSNYDVRADMAPLRLQRRPSRTPDELGRMAETFNEMSVSLRAAYDDLRLVNTELEIDIAARRKAEEEVIRLNAGLEETVRLRTAELEAANKELAAFTYSVSHDLRAPLRRIEGFSRLIEEDWPESADTRSLGYLGRIRAGANDMGEMIDSFLKLSQAARSELTLEDIDLSALAQEINQACAEKEPGRAVVVEIEPGLVVRGDRRFLRIALANLFENAWKYSQYVETARIRFGYRPEISAYVIEDNGAGFDPRNLEKLFMPFRRLHSPERFHGTGIGLATVQRIIVRHGGRIWAEAEVDKGARFFFTLWRDGRAEEAEAA